MKVTFHHLGAHLASSRYRSIIPQQQLKSLGVEPGRDVLVIGKHGWPDDLTYKYDRIVFDICDDHFHHEIHGAHYRKWAAKAQALTCNSLEMARVIMRETGRVATVIPDPYEQSERFPRVHGDLLLWYGHATNLHALLEVQERINRPTIVLSNVDWKGVTQWTPERMDRAFEECGLVILPTSGKSAKSGNRAIEAIRRGLFPVCGPLPAYAELGVWVGDVPDGVEWALSNQDDVIERIYSAQKYIRTRFSPETIGQQWKTFLDRL